MVCVVCVRLGLCGGLSWLGCEVVGKERVRGWKIERVKEKKGVCGVGFCVYVIKQRPTKQGMSEPDISKFRLEMKKILSMEL